LGDGDIVDVKPHKIMGQMKDEHGQVVASEKLLQLTFEDGKLVETDNQFAEGLTAKVSSVTAPGQHASR
jgi:hypothetical protein